MLFPGTTLLEPNKLAAAYIFALVYLFIGLIVAQEKLFSAVDVIISQKSMVTRVDEDDKSQLELPSETWNPSIAMVSIMAISANSPLILLNLMDLTFDFEPKQVQNRSLGYFTIIGSSAFQFLFTQALAITAVASPQAKKVRNFDQYITLAAFAVFSHIWVYLVLIRNTPNEVTFAEALFTLTCFIALVLCLFIQDKIREMRMHQYYDILIRPLHSSSKSFGIVKTN